MKYEPDFLIIPYIIIKDKKLQPLDRILYGAIYYFEKMKEGKCIASNKKLAEYCGCKSPSSIQNSLNRLEESKHIKRFFKDPTTKKIRKEIKCLVTFEKVSSKKYTKNSGVSSNKKVSLNEDIVYSNDDTVSLNDDTNVSSNEYHISNTNISKSKISTPLTGNASVDTTENVLKKILGNNVNDVMGEFYEADKLSSGGSFFGRKTYRKDSEVLIKEFGLKNTLDLIKLAIAVRGKPYAPVITNPTELRSKMVKLKAYVEKESTKKSKIFWGTDFSKE